MKKTRLLSMICIVGYILVVSKTVYAVNVTYDFSGTCQAADWDCGPLGVLDTSVDSVTGTLELGLSEPGITQSWDSATVLTYSFTFDNFTIDNTNSTLSNSLSGNVPFTTTSSSPFDAGDGFLLATYDLDTSIFLNISVGGVNLVQGSLTGCTGSCQALALGSWTRTSAVPVPAAVWLFGSGLVGLMGVARRKKL